MEQMLGHITHHQNLERWAKEEPDVAPTWMPIAESQSDFWENFPVVKNNWSLKASLRASRQLNEALSKDAQSFDALFLHTQTTALFAGSWMRKIPSIVSIDATPINYDAVGEAYGHIPGKNIWLENRKYQWHRSTFVNATHIVSWCHWAKESLVRDYQISADKITVVPPGVDRENWKFGALKKETPPGDKTRLLFVGGDFERKGGVALLKAFRENLSESCELDIVTRDESVEDRVKGLPGIRVLRGLKANSDPLKEAYSRADIFVFPTIADCLPVAVMEAMMAGLPVVTTQVGALSEEVESGVNGMIVPPGDEKALAQAVRDLASNPAKRRAMGETGRKMAEERFDAERNYGKIFDLLRTISNR